MRDLFTLYHNSLSSVKGAEFMKALESLNALFLFGTSLFSIESDYDFAGLSKSFRVDKMEQKILHEQLLSLSQFFFSEYFNCFFDLHFPLIFMEAAISQVLSICFFALLLPSFSSHTGTLHRAGRKNRYVRGLALFSHLHS